MSAARSARRAPRDEARVTSRISQTSFDPAQTETPESLASELKGQRRRSIGFVGYLLLCLLAAVSCSTVTVFLWSDWGCGPRCLEFLQRWRWCGNLSGCIVVVVVIVLYVLDFFCPQHLPGQYLTFSTHDHFVGRGLLLLAAVAFVITLFLMASSFPGAPLMLTTFTGPAIIILIGRRCQGPGLRADAAGRDVIPEGTITDLKLRKARLMECIRSEEEQKVLYSAATWAFAITGTLWLVIWIPWAIVSEEETRRRMAEQDGRAERELFVIRWAVPVIVTVSHIAFASFTGLRVALNSAYNATDVRKNMLFVGRRLNPDHTDHYVAQFLEKLDRDSTDGNPPEAVLPTMQDRRQTYLVQHISYMRQLSGLVKLVGCAFIACLGGLYAAFQVTIADSHVALFVQGFVGAVFVLFVIFVFASFRRLFEAISSKLIEMPLWKSVVGLYHRPWARGFAACVGLPFLPWLLVLSCANQSARRFRGLSHEPAWLTPRVRVRVEGFWDCCWVSVAPWCYIWAYVLVVYTAVPVFLYVLLAFMGEFMRSWPFPLIVVATFATGMFLFMLPPVPGPPIYLFGGMVISEQCPWGFWWGCLIGICLAFSLKMTACAVQQKLIGERLGSRLAIQRAVGVHKPFIRAIETILRRPGLSFGKCAILCGGPDWPTSVLAGILKLSLRQCLIGTSPIIVNCIPLTLTGSFLTRRHESDVWLRSGNLMFSLTVLTSVVFWVGMAWAIQGVFEKHMDDLMQVKEEYVDLDWLDWRDAYIRERCVVRWGDLPRRVRRAYAAGALSAMLTGNFFFWRSKWCFGSADVTAGTSGVVWFGADGVVRPMGAVGLCVVALSCLAHAACRCWVRRLRLERAAAAALECDPREEEWKRSRRVELSEASSSPPTTAAKAISSDEFFLEAETPKTGSWLQEEAPADVPDANLMELGLHKEAAQAKWGAARAADADHGSPCSFCTAVEEASAVPGYLPRYAAMDISSPNKVSL